MSSESKMPEEPPTHSLSKGRIVALGVVVAAAYCVWGILIGLQPPFYPLEAEAKGAEPHQYGFVFGVFNLAAFLGGPIFGRLGGRIGPRILYNVGAFVQAICGFTFGFLTYVEDADTFIWLSYFLRTVQGFADAAGWGAVLTILLKLFPKKVAVIMSYTEGFFGVGFMIGPALGAILYNWGGFILPFALTGSIGLVVAFCMLCIIPTVEPEERQPSQKKLGFRKIFSSPTIFLPFFDNFVCFFGNGFIEGMLQPHLAAAGGSVTQGGMVFFTQGGVFILGMIVCGYIGDKLRYPTLLSAMGNFVLSIAFMFFGPLPFLPIEPNVSVMISCGALLGIGYACCMVSTYSRAQGATQRLGYPKDIDTYILISGMWTSSLYLGCFVGPTMAGFLVEIWGFRTTTIIFWLAYILTLFLDFGELIYYVKTGKSADNVEYQQLK